MAKLPRWLKSTLRFIGKALVEAGKENLLDAIADRDAAEASNPGRPDSGPSPASSSSRRPSQPRPSRVSRPTRGKDPR